MTTLVDLTLTRHLACLDATTERGDARGFVEAVDELLAYWPEMPEAERAELLQRRRDAETVARLEALVAGSPS